MARLPRLVIPNQLHHITQMGVDGRVIFKDEEDFTSFYRWLIAAAIQFEVDVHAYVFLPDRLHLIATPKDELGLGKMMQLIGRYYVPYFNAKHKRTGTLWQGRFKATIIEAEQYFLPCCVMIEELPIRNGIVVDASEYQWSSCQHHLGMKKDELVNDHAMIWALGNTPFQREAGYRTLLDKGLSSILRDEIETMTHKGWVLGSDQFKSELSVQTERRIEPSSRGRPRKIQVES